MDLFVLTVCHLLLGGPSDEQILTAFTDPSKVQDGDPAASGLNQLVQQFTQLTSTVNQQLAAVNSKLLVMEERMAAYEAKANDDDEETSIYREPKVSIGFRLVGHMKMYHYNSRLHYSVVLLLIPPSPSDDEHFHKRLVIIQEKPNM